MFEEMIAEDTKYLEEILTMFKVSKYKLSETATRFKIIIHPEKFPLKTLHNVQEIKTAVGIEVDLKNGVFLECLKSGSSRKRRRISLDVYKGNIPDKYKCGKFEKAIRIMLGIEDICEFQIDVDDDKLVVKDIECLSYPLLKSIEQEGFNVFCNITKASLTITRAKLL
jgi:hypothetical protein